MRRLAMLMAAAGEGGNGGGGAPDWRAALPEEMRGAAFLKDVPDLPTLVKNYGEAQAYRGQSIRIPGPEAAPEARKEFVEKLTAKVPDLVLVADGDDEAAKVAREAVWRRLGRPKEAKEYEAPKGVELPEATLSELRAAAAEEGLTKAQFQARAQRVASALAESDRSAAAERAALKKELGEAYEERVAAAAEAARKLGADEDEVKAIRAGQAPAAYVRRMLAASKALGEPREVGNQGGNGGGGKLTPVEAQARLAEIRANPAYWSDRDPRHAALVRQAEELTRAANPDLRA